MIEIETPTWASFYDSEVASVQDFYSISEQNFNCSSESFTNLTTVTDQKKIILEYIGLTLGQQDEILISCVNYRNPVVPELVDGFIVRTYDIQQNLIDVSESF